MNHCSRTDCLAYSAYGGGSCLAPEAYKHPPTDTDKCVAWAEKLWEDNMPDDIEAYRNEKAMEKA